MSGLDDRENVFEKKFAQDQELQFKVLARRDKLLGVWAAGKLGKTGADVDVYAKSVVASDLEQPGDDDVISKVLADFDQAKVPMDETQLRYEMGRALVEAKRQMMGEI